MNKTYKLNYSVIAFIVMQALFLQSCATISDFNIPRTKQKIGQEQLPIEQILARQFNQLPIMDLVAKKLTAEKWEVIGFYKGADGLKVQAIEHHGAFSRWHELSIHMAEVIGQAEVSRLSSKQEQRLVYIHPQQSCVFIFKGGLLGGMKKGDKEVNQEASLSEPKLDVSKYNWTHLYEAALSIQMESLLLAESGDIRAKCKDNWAAVHVATANGQVEEMRLLVAQGADLNAKGKDNWTPLHMAALNGHLEVVRLLLAQGVELNAKGKNNWTPLHVAALNGHVEVVSLLLEQQEVNIDATDKDDICPLHIAVENGRVEVLKLLVDRGVDINAKSKDGWNVLHMAAYNGQVEVVKLLAGQQGIDINSKCKDNICPLHMAITNEQLKVAKALIKYGADVNIKGEDNWTALHIAACDNNLKLVKLLIKYGADIHARDSKSLIPLQVVSPILENYTEIVALLT